MMVQQPTGGNTTMFVTESMTIGIQKLTRHGLSKASYSVTGEGNNTGDFVFPNIASKLASGQDFGVKVRIQILTAWFCIHQFERVKYKGKSF